MIVVPAAMPAPVTLRPMSEGANVAMLVVTVALLAVVVGVQAGVLVAWQVRLARLETRASSASWTGPTSVRTPLRLSVVVCVPSWLTRATIPASATKPTRRMMAESIIICPPSSPTRRRTRRRQGLRAKPHHQLQAVRQGGRGGRDGARGGGGRRGADHGDAAARHRGDEGVGRHVGALDRQADVVVGEERRRGQGGAEDGLAHGAAARRGHEEVAHGAAGAVAGHGGRRGEAPLAVRDALGHLLLDAARRGGEVRRVVLAVAGRAGLDGGLPVGVPRRAAGGRGG